MADIPSIERPGPRAAPSVASFGLHLAPTLLVVVLALDLLGGSVAVVLAFGALLVAPGWLVWKLLGGPISRDWVALPALWVVLSFTIMSPALAVMVFVGGPALGVEIYAAVVLLGLGVAATRVPHPALDRIDRPAVALIGVAAVVMLYRWFSWSGSGDELTFLGYIRATALGSYPAENPFMSGDLPLNPRWRFGGWTGSTGVLAHLADADPQAVLQTILPTLLVALVGSALYLFARVFSGDRRLAVVAGIAALLIPLITSTAGKTDFKFAFHDIEFDKYTAMLIFVPVAASLLVAVYRNRQRSMLVLTTLVLWSSLWVHAVMIILGVAAFAAYVLFDRLLNKPEAWRTGALWCAVAITPLLVTAALASITQERFGTLAGDVDQLSDIATPGRKIGPLQLWTPRSVGNIRDASLDDAAAIFSRGYISTTEGPVVMFLPNGWPMPHPDILGNPRYLVVALAVLIIVLGRHRDPVAVWILATTAVALSVYLIPPLAVLAAKVVTPWQLYRFAWLLPVPLATAWLIGRWLYTTRHVIVGGLLVGVTLGIIWSESSHRQLFQLDPPASYQRLAEDIANLEGESGVLMASRDLMNAAASRWPDIDVVSFRGLSSMSNGFVLAEQRDAFQRFQDARTFFTNISSEERLVIIERHDIDLVIIHQSEVGDFDLESLGLTLVRELGHGNLLFERGIPAASRVRQTR